MINKLIYQPSQSHQGVTLQTDLLLKQNPFLDKTIYIKSYTLYSKVYREDVTLEKTKLNQMCILFCWHPFCTSMIQLEKNDQYYLKTSINIRYLSKGWSARVKTIIWLTHEQVKFGKKADNWKLKVFNVKEFWTINMLSFFISYINQKLKLMAYFFI